jgi:hypothetical protein
MSGILAAAPVSARGAALPAGLALYLNPADATTITISSGNSISQINDKSSNHNNASQGTGSAQPTRVAGDQNGLDVIDFSAASSQRFLLSSPIDVSSGLTAIFVGLCTGSNILNVLGSNANPADFYCELYHSSQFFSALSGHQMYTTGMSGSATYRLFSVLNDGAGGGSIYVNGVSTPVTFNTSAPLHASINAVGSGDSLYANGRIAALAVWPRALSSIERAAAEAIINTGRGLL